MVVGGLDPSFSPLPLPSAPNFDPVSFLFFQNSHAACQTELLLFNSIIQDLLHCPADVHSHALGRRQPHSQRIPGRPPAPHGALTRPGRDCRNTRPRSCISSQESVSPCFPQRSRGPRTDLPGELRGWGSLLRDLLFRCSEPWAPRLRGSGAAAGSGATAALHVPASLLLAGCVSGLEGYGMLLNVIFLRNVPMLM